MCVCACTWVCVYVCLRACAYACMYVCLRVCAYACMYARDASAATNTGKRARAHTHTNILRHLGRQMTHQAATATHCRRRPRLWPQGCSAMRTTKSLRLPQIQPIPLPRGSVSPAWASVCVRFAWSAFVGGRAGKEGGGRCMHLACRRFRAESAGACTRAFVRVSAVHQKKRLQCCAARRARAQKQVRTYTLSSRPHTRLSS